MTLVSREVCHPKMTKALQIIGNSAMQRDEIAEAGSMCDDQGRERHRHVQAELYDTALVQLFGMSVE